MPKCELGHLSKSVEDYLKAIWLGAQNGPVATRTIAATLGVSDASVSGMLVKLSELELVSYTRYHGATLTPAGERQALQIVRRHRLIETFLIKYLGFGWDEVHSEAEALEHTVSDRFTERLAAQLGHPSHDPHGDPIPRPDGTLPETPDVSLADLSVGETLEVARLKTQEADVLAYLAELNIQPGGVLRVTRQEPLGSLVQVEIEGVSVPLSKALATLIRGRHL